MSNILFSIKTENKIFNSFFTKIFVSQTVSKVFNKHFGEKKLLNILFSIKMENKIYNSLSTEVFVSPCVYKLIIYIYIFSYLEPAQKSSVCSWIGTCALQARHKEP